MSWFTRASGSLPKHYPTILQNKENLDLFSFSGRREGASGTPFWSVEECNYPLVQRNITCAVTHTCFFFPPQTLSHNSVEQRNMCDLFLFNSGRGALCGQNRRKGSLLERRKGAFSCFRNYVSTSGHIFTDTVHLNHLFAHIYLFLRVYSFYFIKYTFLKIRTFSVTNLKCIPDIPYHDSEQ